MFVVKNPDVFATTIIPQYFDHNKFSSFARQLNFYGFRKMQARPIRNVDFDMDSAKHVTFFNEKFRRGRCDLLKEIQRSTRGGGSSANQDQLRQIEDLKKQVSNLESKLKETNENMEERMRRLELDMLSRMEQMMLAMQQNHQLQQMNKEIVEGLTATQQRGPQDPSWDPLPLDRNKSILSLFKNESGKISTNGPTLAPHPKQKSFPMSSIPLPPSRFNSLRGISRGLSRNTSENSQLSALLRGNSTGGNAWEDKFLSMVLLGGGAGDGNNNNSVGQQQKQTNNSNNNNSSMEFSDAALAAAAAQIQSLAKMSAEGGMNTGSNFSTTST